MRNNKGFTLVELLVVMAIIAILASITVPNVIGFIRGARATRALTEVSSIETSLTKVLADAGRSSLHHLFNPEAVRDKAGIGLPLGQPLTTEGFQAAVTLYTNVLYALLREGRLVLTDTESVSLPNGNSVYFSEVLRPEVIGKLGTGYMEVGFDPWGNLYNIYPGPWPSGGAADSAIPFRVYTVEAAAGKDLPGSKGGAQQDILTGALPDVEGDREVMGSYAAPRNEVAYVWSYGANLLSGQAIYQNNYDVNSEDAHLFFYAEQENQFKGGGDDVNSWDNERSWERFYN